MLFAFVMCSIEFTLSTMLNLMFADRSWLESIKAYPFYTLTNQYVDGDHSFGSLLFVTPLVALIDILRIYILHLTYFGTFITWTITAFTWYLTYVRMQPYFHVLKDEDVKVQIVKEEDVIK